MRYARKLAKYVAVLIAAALLVVLGVRIYDSQTGPTLQLWHTYVPTELTRSALGSSDWKDYLAAEDKIFDRVRRDVSLKISEDQKIPVNRYFEGSPVHAARFPTDYNRSFVLEPEGKPVGAVVLLHGLTDSPYSQRHFARFYRDRGFVAIVPRLPGHGTVPGELTDIGWEDWLAATKLAVREARRRVDPSLPLHLVGYSNGGALAVMVALDALEDVSLARPDRIVLISPMIGIARAARFSWIAELPAMLPAFAKAAWLGIEAEYNPFKYNSFPVNGARQSHLLTNALQDRVARLARAGRLEKIAPILSFNSVVDFTVSTSAAVTGLFAHLPANGSELVLFDVNRNVKFGPLLRQDAETALARIVPSAPQRFRITTIVNAPDRSARMVERTRAPGSQAEDLRDLDLAYPGDMFSMSHIALPFPVTDSLYGSEPDRTEDFGINLGLIAPRGERNVLTVSPNVLLRVSSTPFFPYMLARVSEILPKH